MWTTTNYLRKLIASLSSRLSWLRKLPPRRSPKRFSSFRPCLEALETREVPASHFYVVTGLAEGFGALTTPGGDAGTQADPYQDTTLRGALANATADGGTDTILFAPSLFTNGSQTITLFSVGDSTAGPSDFGISTNITIEGPTGNNGLTLANSSGVSQRLFYVGTTGSLTLENLTLTGGLAQGGGAFLGGGAAGLGGAIFNQGTLSLVQSTLSGNTAQGGTSGVGGFGGTRNGYSGGGLDGAGTGLNGGGPNGGAGDPSEGSVGGGGGFGGGGGYGYDYGGGGGFGGGGAFGNGASGRGGFGGGGGGFGRGYPGHPGFDLGSGFGGGYGNQIYGGGGAGLGGAIFNAAGTVIITNSTLAGNTAKGGAGGPGAGNGSGFGGALFNLNGSIILTNDTLADNTVAAGGVGKRGSAAGGALYTLGLNGVLASAVAGQTTTIGAAADAQATLVNSIFADSTGGLDIVNNNSTLNGTNNLATQSSGLPDVVYETTPSLLNLGSLADNGGPTETIALLPGSSAIDAGLDTSLAPYDLTTDQRGAGFARKVGSEVDIGAFEATPLVSTATALTTSSSDVLYGQSVVLTATVSIAAPGATAPSGIVTFLEDGVSLGTGILDGLAGNDQATLTIKLPAGTYNLIAVYGGDDFFSGSTSATSSALVVDQASPTITWSTPAAIVYGSSLSSAQLDAAASVPGTFTYTPAVGTVLGAGTQTLNVTFAPNDSTDYTAATASVTVVVNRATPQVMVNPVDIIAGTALNNSQLSGAASFVVNGTTVGVAGVFTFTSAAGKELAVGNNQIEDVTFTPTDLSNYIPVQTTVTVDVAGQPLLIGVRLVSITYGTALSNNQLRGTAMTASSPHIPVAGVFSYTTAAGSVLGAGDNQIVQVTFTPHNTVLYAPVQTTVTIDVAKATPRVTIDPVLVVPDTALNNSQLSGTAVFIVNGKSVTVAGVFTYTNDAGSVLGEGVHPSEVTFTPTDSTDYKSVQFTIFVIVARTDCWGLHIADFPGVMGGVFVG